jgi:CO/xanthine dehydrogenase FAD-binding subunit
VKLGARRYLVISIVMVAASLECDAAGRVARAALAVGACSARAQRLPALEAALEGHLPDPALIRPEHAAALTPIDDIRGTAAYRAVAVLELLRRALADLAPQAAAA